jgi:hypothetical protein
MPNCARALRTRTPAIFESTIPRVGFETLASEFATSPEMRETISTALPFLAMRHENARDARLELH